nr:MAG TPA: hypothetical protein [Caudoviricetes sp.]
MSLIIALLDSLFICKTSLKFYTIKKHNTFRYRVFLIPRQEGG